MVVQIPLRKKYLATTKGRYKGGANAAPPKHRAKTGRDRHVALFGEPIKRVLVVDGKTGKSHMENY